MEDCFVDGSGNLVFISIVFVILGIVFDPR